MIEETHKRIQETMAITERAQERMRSVQGASNDLQKRWEDYQAKFQLCISRLAEAVADSLQGEEGVGRLESVPEHCKINVDVAVDMIKNTENIVVLTGAGVSVASGIPTYRGNDGTWVEGTSNYTPQQIATRSFFDTKTEFCWRHYRRWHARTKKAKPNEGHYALVALQSYIEGKSDSSFALITQNIDNLHVRAGHPLEMLYQIHGNLEFTRCSAQCCSDHFPFPEQDASSSDIPTCPKCGEPLRPHVLWFDECYTEEDYRSSSAVAVVESADLLITIGTTFQTGLPNRLLRIANKKKCPVIDINPVANDDVTATPLFQLTEASQDVLPKIVEQLLN